MADPNTLLFYLKKSTEFLEKKGIPTPRVDAEWILSDLLNLPRIKLYAQFEMPLGTTEITTYRERIVERGKNKPVAYIIGKKGFHRFDFFVNEHVLIPRPETEELVDYVFKNKESLFGENQNSQILDLCTGSGCIGLSLTKLIPNSSVFLSDISEAAILVAKTNAKNLEVDSKVQFFHSNLFEEIPLELKFDLIVSNPPYIPVSEKSEIMDDVLLYEPHLALFVEDFVSFHRTLVTGCFNKIKENGTCILETHPNLIQTLISIVKEVGFTKSEIIKDSSGKDRFLIFQK
ncbi:peptide chain release factor N(5)-glutamine methyltransferase [Leptospira sp. 96542]|nr:peptide chain release factor N(5)-glutamine methyltransferase [Leptospira sp. 96542]